MARKKPASALSPGERFAGTLFLIIYLLVLPLASGPLFRAAGKLLGRRILGDMQAVVYYYLLFAVTALIFRGFLVRTTRRMLEDVSGIFKNAFLGLIGLYGLNHLVGLLAGALTAGRANLNDGVISSRIGGAPHMTLLTVLLLAPFVEEVLFRGLVFGCLRERSRLLGYAVSCLLFALAHVWQFAVASRDAAYFLVALQYLAPGIVLAWAFEHTGTLWTSILLHAAANGLSVLALLE